MAEVSMGASEVMERRVSAATMPPGGETRYVSECYEILESVRGHCERSRECYP